MLRGSNYLLKGNTRGWAVAQTIGMTKLHSISFNHKSNSHCKPSCSRPLLRQIFYINSITVAEIMRCFCFIWAIPYLCNLCHSVFLLTLYLWMFIHTTILVFQVIYYATFQGGHTVFCRHLLFRGRQSCMATNILFPRLWLLAVVPPTV